MSQDSCPTVRVASDDPATGGYIVINAEDFDPSVHKLHTNQPPQEEAQEESAKPRLKPKAK